MNYKLFTGLVNSGFALTLSAINQLRDCSRPKCVTTYDYGNRCGHIPHVPRWYVPPTSHKPRPHDLEEIQARLKVSKIFDNFRSERTEAINLVMGTLVHHTNLKRGRVGIPTDDGDIMGFTYQYLANDCGLTLKRFQRAINELKAAGLVEIKRKYIKIQEGFKAIASEIVILDKFFKLLGFNADRIKRMFRRKGQKGLVPNKSGLDQPPKTQFNPPRSDEKRSSPQTARQIIAHLKNRLKPP